MGGVQVGRRGRRERGVGVSVQSVGEMGKDFCANFLKPFLENIDRRSCNVGSVSMSFPRLTYNQRYNYDLVSWV